MIKKSKLLGAIRPCVWIFDIFGFSGNPIGTKRSKIVALLTVIKYVAMIGILGFLFVDALLSQINRLRDSHGITIHLVFFISIASQGLVAVLQTIASASTFSEIQKRLTRVDELLLNLLSIQSNYRSLRWSLVISTVVSLLFYFTCSFFTLYVALKRRPNILRLGLSFHIPINLGRIFILRFIFLIRLLTFYLNAMIESLEKSISNQPMLVRKDERSNWKWNMRSNHFKMKVMQQAYRLLWEVSILINNCFDVGLIVIVLVQCLTLLYQGYTLCVDITQRKANYRQLILIAPTSFELFSLHYYCQQCLHSVIS